MYKAMEINGFNRVNWDVENIHNIRKYTPEVSRCKMKKFQEVNIHVQKIASCIKHQELNKNTKCN